MDHAKESSSDGKQGESLRERLKEDLLEVDGKVVDDAVGDARKKISLQKGELCTAAVIGLGRRLRRVSENVSLLLPKMHIRIELAKTYSNSTNVSGDFCTEQSKLKQLNKIPRQITDIPAPPC